MAVELLDQPPHLRRDFHLTFVFLDVHNPETPFLDGLKAIDWFGSLSIIELVLMLLLGLDFGGATVPWNSPRVICLIVFGVLMSIAFIYSEKRLAQYPLMPLKLFTDQSNAASLLLTLWHGMVMSSPSYLPAPIQVTELIDADLHRRRILPSPLFPIRQRLLSFDLRPPNNAYHNHRSTNRIARRLNNTQNWSLSGHNLCRRDAHDHRKRTLHSALPGLNPRRDHHLPNHRWNWRRLALPSTADRSSSSGISRRHRNSHCNLRFRSESCHIPRRCLRWCDLPKLNGYAYPVSLVSTHQLTIQRHGLVDERWCSGECHAE